MPKLGYYIAGNPNMICDQCGRGFKSSDISKRWDNALVCRTCLEPRHPQDFVRGVPDNPAFQPARPRMALPSYYANFPTGTNYASIQNDPTIIFSNYLDVRVKASATNWNNAATTQILLAKSTTSGTAKRTFSFGVINATWVYFAWNTETGNSSAFSSAYPTLTNGSTYWLRSTYSASGNAVTVNFYTSTDYNPDGRDGTWTAVGVAQTGSGAPLRNGNEPVTLKIDAFNPTADFIGKIYYAEILNSINGQTVYSFDPAGTIDTTKVASTSSIWTLSGATMIEI